MEIENFEDLFEKIESKTQRYFESSEDEDELNIDIIRYSSAGIQIEGLANDLVVMEIRSHENMEWVEVLNSSQSSAFNGASGYESIEKLEGVPFFRFKRTGSADGTIKVSIILSKND